jgi:cell wall-associated NlpC family hydrolase
VPLVHKRFANVLAATVTIGVLAAAPRPSAATTASANIPNTLRDSAATSEARELLVRVDDALNALTYTYYSEIADYWNDATGVYKVDCSGYVNRLVEDAVPSSYDAICDERDTTRPAAEDYYYTFRAIPYDTTRDHWRRIKRVKDLRPGDVLVWRYLEPDEHDESTGHTMIVVGLPERDTRWSNVYRVRVSDSARSGHSSDNRGNTGSGVGAGVMLLRYDPDSGVPTAYAWSLLGYWQTDIRFAAARPD